MSTKIYDGMIAVDKNPFTVMQRIKEVIEPMFYEQYFAAYEMVRAEFDKGEESKTWLELFGPFPTADDRYAEWDRKISEDAKFLLDTKLYKLIEALQDDPKHTFTSLDFAYRVILLPNGRGAGAHPLVLLFSERGGSEYRSALVDADVLEEYGYWDNTDQPDEITDKEWRHRKRAWDTLDVPADDGLLINTPSRTSVQIKRYEYLRGRG